MKRVASVDPLYTALVEREEHKLAKRAADLKWSCPALPLEGIEDAFTEMADQIILHCKDSGDSCRWAFFYGSPPKPHTHELKAHWWKFDVVKWWKRLEDQVALITKEGSASQQREWRDLTKYATMIRATIADCWNARHPQLTGSWEAEGYVFVVTYERK